MGYHKFVLCLAFVLVCLLVFFGFAAVCYVLCFELVHMTPGYSPSAPAHEALLTLRVQSTIIAGM